MSELATHWIRAWMDMDFVACCTPDVQYEDPLAPEPLRGIDELAAHARRLRDAFPDLRIERAADPLMDGAYACIPWRAAGTNRGASGSLPATNRFVTLHGLHYVELVDGHIRKARGFYDLYDAAMQLGLLPQRGGIGESVLLLLRGFGLRAS